MNKRIGKWVWNVLAVGVVTLGSSTGYADWVVAPGWDLFTSLDGTTFNGQPFNGSPLGSFDFGGPIGIQTLQEDIDTIVHRTEEASVAGAGQTDTIEIELVALSLVSANQFDWGAGLGYHYITLDTAPSSTGTMDITFDSEAGGTFSSSFTVYYDIRIGAYNGPIITSGNHVMSASGTPWGRVSPANDYEIQDVNYLLDGSTTDQDFWPGGSITHIAPSGDQHVVAIPEPATMGLLGLVSGGIYFARRFFVA